MTATSRPLNYLADDLYNQVDSEKKRREKNKNKLRRRGKQVTQRGKEQVATETGQQIFKTFL